MEVAGDTGNSQRLFKFSRDTDGRWILVRESSCNWNGKSIHDSQQGLHCWPTYFKKEFTWLYANVVSLTTTATSCLLTLTELTIVLVIRLLKWGRPFPTKFSPPPTISFQIEWRGPVEITPFSVTFITRCVFRYHGVSCWVYSSSRREHALFMPIILQSF